MAAETVSHAANVRHRDGERFAMETSKGIYAGRDLIHGDAPRKDASAEPEAPR